MTNLFEKKDCVIAPIRVTASEKLEVEMLAAASNKKVSAFILDCIFNKEKDCQSIDPIKNELLVIEYLNNYKKKLQLLQTDEPFLKMKINQKKSIIEEIIGDILNFESTKDNLLKRI